MQLEALKIMDERFGHTNENDKNTCLLKICLTDGILFNQGTRYDINFANK